MGVLKNKRVTMQRRILTPIGPEKDLWREFDSWFFQKCMDEKRELVDTYKNHAENLRLYVENVHNMVLQQFPEFIPHGIWNPVRTKEGTSIPFDEA